LFLEPTQAVVLFLDLPARTPYAHLSQSPGVQADAVAVTGTQALSLVEHRALERMGYTDPFRVNTLFTQDGGYDHTAALDRVSTLLMERLAHQQGAHMWTVRGCLRGWRWWALRDGLVGLPSSHITRFLPNDALPGPRVPEGCKGIPLLTLPGRAHSAHARLAAQGRLLDDLAIALAQAAPNTHVVATHWLA
jgi:hypothetical protein